MRKTIARTLAISVGSWRVVMEVAGPDETTKEPSGLDVLDPKGCGLRQLTESLS
jgi:hypothetical protein